MREVFNGKWSVHCSLVGGYFLNKSACPDNNMC